MALRPIESALALVDGLVSLALGPAAYRDRLLSRQCRRLVAFHPTSMRPRGGRRTGSTRVPSVLVFLVL